MIVLNFVIAIKKKEKAKQCSKLVRENISLNWKLNCMIVFNIEIFKHI